MSQSRCFADSMRPSIEPLTSSAMTRSTSRRASFGATVSAAALKPGAQNRARAARRVRGFAAGIVVSYLVKVDDILAVAVGAFKTRTRKRLAREFTSALRGPSAAPGLYLRLDECQRTRRS